MTKVIDYRDFVVDFSRVWNMISGAKLFEMINWMPC